MNYAILLFFILLFSCKAKQPLKEPFYDVINQAFLQLVDTSAYTNGRFVKIPGVRHSFPISDQYNLVVDTLFLKDDNVDEHIKWYIQKQPKLKEFIPVLSKMVKDSVVDLTMITNSGKYFLVPTKPRTGLTIEGKIYFYRPYVTEDKAIIPIEIWDSPKSGFTKCYFFKKLGHKWTKVSEYLMFIS